MPRPKPPSSNQLQPPVAAAQPQGAQSFGLPPQSVWLANAPLDPVDTALRLSDRPRVTVAFPPCTDELLSLIKSGDQRDEISRSFIDYFKRARHTIFGEELASERTDQQPPTYRELGDKLKDELDGNVLTCGKEGRAPWPRECCVCNPCVTLDGLRNHPDSVATNTPGITRLFIGDVVWLFYYERMGIQQILGAILDAYATTGRLPISNGSLEPGIVRDDVVALVLEIMVRQAKMGLSSSVRDRGALYRTAIGWESAPARGLGLDTETNSGFSTLFHRFIYKIGRAHV